MAAGRQSSAAAVLSYKQRCDMRECCCCSLERWQCRREDVPDSCRVELATGQLQGAWDNSPRLVEKLAKQQ
jgi:hypothetical protein